MDGYLVLGGAFLLGLTMVGGAWKAIRVLGSIQQLVDAQLRTNGGGSLVDRVARVHAEMFPVDIHGNALQSMPETMHKLEEQLRESGCDALAATVNANHDEARYHWKTLETQAADTSKAVGEIKRELVRGSERMAAIERRLDGGGL